MRLGCYLCKVLILYTQKLDTQKLGEGMMQMRQNYSGQTGASSESTLQPEKIGSRFLTTRPIILLGRI
jgi:hypothetical protein